MRPRWGPKNSRSPGLGSSPIGRASVAPNWSRASRGSETPCSASTCCVNAEQSNPSGVRPPQRYGTPSSRRTLSSIDGRHPIGTIARDSTQPRRPSGSSTVRYPPRARPATSRAFRTTGPPPLAGAARSSLDRGIHEHEPPESFPVGEHEAPVGAVVVPHFELRGLGSRRTVLDLIRRAELDVDPAHVGAPAGAVALEMLIREP